MPRSCCIPKCKNTTNDRFHLFRLPLKRADILKMWVNAIGKDFEPKPSHYICSAHFTPTDFMERPGKSGERLKNLAVPSIFLEASVPAVPDVESSVIESCTTSATETHEIESITTCAKETPALAYATMKWKSILKSRQENSTDSTSLPSLNFEDPVARTSDTSDTLRMTIQKKPRKVMSNSLIRLQKYHMSPREKVMWRKIKTLKQKVKRKDEKIQSLTKLLENLRAKNLVRDASEIIANNFDVSVGELFKNKWINRKSYQKLKNLKTALAR